MIALPKVGIVGCGFVGGAIAQGFSTFAEIKIFDKLKPGFDSMEEVAAQDFIFVSVPTQTKKSGEQVLEHLLEVGEKLNVLSRLNARRPVVILKSTMLPGTTRMLADRFQAPRWVFSPEFLTARAARLDFINAARIVIGMDRSDPEPAHLVKELFAFRFPTTPIHMMGWEEAELVKYMANCFFSLKVSYLNEIFDVCQALGADYEVVKAAWLADGRIGNSHHQIPGHDGDRGFGGTCFPKDLKAFVAWAGKNGLPVRTLSAAQEVNLSVRKKIDWEEPD